MREGLVDEVRQFLQNAEDNGYPTDAAISDREVAEDLWLKAGVLEEDTIEDLTEAVKTVRNTH